ncbi:response regulator [Pontibacillus salicampi]|uniref:Response regulator n=1 Tax=Pontibacillus salicampi TaxID=1449801 RepID=A0ABV6LI11_9BACI
MINVIVVDDHTVLREGICKVIELEKTIRVVEEANSGRELRQQLAKQPPDVILLDIHLPEENGIELTLYIKEHYPQCKVLVLTMADEEHYMKAALDAGADGYMLKETSSEELIRGILNVCKGDCIISPSMTKKLLLPYRQKQPEASRSLTNREREVLKELAKGLTNKEIANILYISDQTVKIHISNIYKKLKVKSRSQAIVYAVEKNLVSII